MNKNNNETLLQQYKRDGLYLPIKDGAVVAITYDYQRQMPDCVSKLSKWRIENPSLSPTRFPVSDDRTESWLNNAILNNSKRIMFMIQNHKKENIGHIGLSNFNYENSCIRFDSVMKGVKNQYPGIMFDTIEALKLFCAESFNAKMVDLVVLSDNERAIGLYHRCGFINNKMIPLRKIKNGNEINWEEDYSLIDAEKYYLHMYCKL